MIRPAFTEVGIFLIPFAVYALFLIAITLRIAGAGIVAAACDRQACDRRHAAGGRVSFVLLAHFSSAPPNSTYVPAHIENGKFVPGVEK